MCVIVGGGWIPYVCVCVLWYCVLICVTLHSANVGHSALNYEAATAAQGYSAREMRLFNAFMVKTLGTGHTECMCVCIAQNTSK